MRITRTSETEFKVETGQWTADGRPINDVCTLQGSRLTPVPCAKGEIRTVWPVKVNLGPKSLEAVEALAVGESWSNQ